MSIPEDFLHYLWKFRLFSQQGLATAAGDSIEIISVGLHNKNAGPDFESAKIRIGKTLWVGNVEIHLRSSDWERHQHQLDQTYDSVILHVVANHDKDIFRTDGTKIPAVSLGALIPQKISDNYLRLQESMEWIPCGKQISSLNPFHIRTWLHRVEIERLEEKSGSINEVLNEFKGSWDDAFYIFLARNFGFKTNAMPFEMLARSLPQTLLARYKNRPLQIESLIFGQAGFLLSKHMDEYPEILRKEYLFLQKKHLLQPMDNYLWKYMRMRPVNFPTIRLAQFAALIIRSNHLFSRILIETDMRKIIGMFDNLPVNDYWRKHFRFDTETACSYPGFGKQSIDNILINTVSIFLMAYGRSTDSAEHISRSISLLENLPGETNALVNRFKETGLNVENAFFSQSLLQLKKAYCDQKKCLSCGIGMKLLNG